MEVKILNLFESGYQRLFERLGKYAIFTFLRRGEYG
jgi:hypothetical protein